MVAVEKRGAEETFSGDFSGDFRSPPWLMALKYFTSKAEEDTVFH